MNINLTVLKDKAYDVDPDLRFMALDDFQKYLNDDKVTKNLRHIEGFIPILFKLLSDDASEVQNQAIKSFVPMMPYINNEELLKIIERLYEEVHKINLKENNKSDKKFTTSIPNMVLRLIFNNSNYKFSEQLSRKVIDLLVPKIFSNTIDIDSIEILIDLFKNLGDYLKDDEILDLSINLINLTFSTSGISSKRSIIAFDYLLNQLNRIENDYLQSEYLDKIVDEINFNFNKTDQSNNDITQRFIIFQIFLNNLKKNKAKNLSIIKFNEIYEILIYYLKLDDIDKFENDIEDIDLDLINSTNSIREDSLITLNDLVNSVNFDLLNSKLDSILSIIKIIINYDPFKNDDEDFEDFDEDIEFSDDDDEINYNNSNDENDGNSSKLRIQSIQLIKNFVVNYPQETLSIVYNELIEVLINLLNDKSIEVSNESIKTIIIIINSTTKPTKRQRSGSDVSMTTNESPIYQLVYKWTPILQDNILNKLMIYDNLARFPIFIQLLESLIGNTGENLNQEFFNKVYLKLIEFKITSNTNNEILNLYKILLKNIEINLIPIEFIEKILKDLSISINDQSTYHNFIIEGLNLVILITDKINNEQISQLTLLINDEIIPSIMNKVHDKQYSSDLRQKSISSLSKIISKIELNPNNKDKMIEIFKESLNYEITVNYTIENLIKINNIDNFFDQDFIDYIIPKLINFINSSDSSLYLNSLILFDLLICKSNVQIDERIVENLINIIENLNDFKIINLSISILSNLEIQPIFYGKFFQKINKFDDFEEINLRNFERLIKNLTKDSKIYDIAIENLNIRNFISAKIISIIIIELGMTSIVNQVCENIQQYLKEKTYKEREELIFNIQLIGYISNHININIELEDLYEILQESSNDELIQLATSRSIGIYILKDLTKYLPNLLEKYSESTNSSTNNKLLLISLKQVLKIEINFENQMMLWDNLIKIIDGKQESDTEIDYNELKLLGDILSQIIYQNDNFYNKFLNKLEPEEEVNQYELYINIVIIKQLVGFNYPIKEDLIIKSLINYNRIEKIEIKQAIISTLLTGIHNKIDIFIEHVNNDILPMIFEELDAKDYFKKTIPMGPYKYIIDEGLEIRKLSYELLNTIINLNLNIDIGKIFDNIVNKGLNDLENDIIILSSLNLINLINKFTITTFDLTELIEKLTKQINKKIRAKASTQELESYEESIKSIIKLLKVLNNKISNNLTWVNYYNDMKTKHYTLYNSV